MRRTTTALLAVATLVVAAGVAVTVWLLVRPSYDDHVKACEKALTKSATKTDRPDACEPLSQDDYDTLLMGWALDSVLDDMPKKDRDLLDYHDDGSINGSLD
jgi:hypothetical protein